MSDGLFGAVLPFVGSTKKSPIPVVIIKEKKLSAWLKKQKAAVQQQVKQSSFQGGHGQQKLVYDDKGALALVLVGAGDSLSFYDTPVAVQALRQAFSHDVLKGFIFALEGPAVSAAELEKACVGWGWAQYEFAPYKDSGQTVLKLVWPKGIDKKHVESLIEGVGLIRTLVNMPANDMGPEELAQAAKTLAKPYEAKISVVSDDERIRKNYPLVYAVGHSSPRRPRFIDLKWGNPKHPKVTLVGKGVCFDTGGLDIKPPRYMLLMKKDMGGAAHALGLALMIMKNKLPVRLRVLIPAVENAVSGDAFRPKDVLQSRKGLSVEIGDTDAEGRLVLADALTVACEEKPDLLMDFATLTGSARAALGADIPAFLSNRDQYVDELRTFSDKTEDLVWPLPCIRAIKKRCIVRLPILAVSGPGWRVLFMVDFFLRVLLSLLSTGFTLICSRGNHRAVRAVRKGGPIRACALFMLFLRRNIKTRRCFSAFAGHFV